MGVTNRRIERNPGITGLEVVKVMGYTECHTSSVFFFIFFINQYLLASAE